MKNLFKTTVIVIIAFGFVSCGGGEDVKEEKTAEEKIKDNPFGALQEMAENMEDVAKEMEEMAESFENGEGGTPIEHIVLQRYLPNEIEGYVTEDPEGATLDMQGFSVSNAEGEYTAENGDYVKVTIMDYFAAMSLYKMATAMWGSGIVIDSDDEYAKAFSINEDVNGWETFDKKNNKASVVAGIGNRLLVSIEANNQSGTEEVNEILTSMNLDGMAMVSKQQK